MALELGLGASIAGRLFFPRKYKMGSIDIDTFVEESHVSEVLVTSHPVEQGMEITDNIVRQPYRVTVQGAVSMSNSNEFFDWGIQGTIKKFAGFVLPGVFGSRVVDAWEALLALQSSGERFEIQTGLKLYTDMVIVSLSASQDRITSQSLQFTAVLREVVTVKSEKSEVELIGDVEPNEDSRSATERTNSTTADRASEETARGTGAAIDVPEGTEQSVLSRALDWWSGRP